MSRLRAAVVASVLIALIATPAAVAHKGNPSYRSVITAVSPDVDGVRLEVLNGDDRLALQNRAADDRHRRLQPRAIRAPARRRHGRGQPPLAGLLPQPGSLRRRQGARVGQPEGRATVEARRSQRPLRVARPPHALDGQGAAQAGRPREARRRSSTGGPAADGRPAGQPRRAVLAPPGARPPVGAFTAWARSSRSAARCVVVVRRRRRVAAIPARPRWRRGEGAAARARRARALRAPRPTRTRR